MAEAARRSGARRDGTLACPRERSVDPDRAVARAAVQAFVAPEAGGAHRPAERLGDHVALEAPAGVASAEHPPAGDAARGTAEMEQQLTEVDDRLGVVQRLATAGAARLEEVERRAARYGSILHRCIMPAGADLQLPA